jgi:hypothetical protein
LPARARDRPGPQGHRLHGSTDLKRGTLRTIITQAGLTVAEFIEFL